MTHPAVTTPTIMVWKTAAIRSENERKAVGHTGNVLDMANSCDYVDSTSESQDTLNREACMCKA